MRSLPANKNYSESHLSCKAIAWQSLKNLRGHFFRTSPIKHKIQTQTFICATKNDICIVNSNKIHNQKFTLHCTNLQKLMKCQICTPVPNLNISDKCIWRRFNLKKHLCIFFTTCTSHMTVRNIRQYEETYHSDQDTIASLRGQKQTRKRIALLHCLRFRSRCNARAKINIAFFRSSTALKGSLRLKP